MSDFIVSMALTAVNDVTPVLTQISAQLDAMKANLAQLNAAVASVDMSGLSSTAMTDTARQADTAAASVAGLGAAWETTSSGLILPAGTTAVSDLANQADAAQASLKATSAMAPDIAAASLQANSLKGSMGNAGKAAADTAGHVATVKQGLKAISEVGLGMTAVGGVLGFGVVESLKMAGELQSTLTTIQDVTGATNSQMQSLNNTILNTSANVSRFTDLDVAGFAQQLASGGLGSMKNVQSLLMPMTQFADAQMYEGKVASGSDAVTMAINMAHLLGHYDPKSLLNSLNTFNKYSNMEPGSSDDLYQTLKYLAPTARQLKMNETSTMQMAALANRVGLTGSHGGTNAADLVMRLIPNYIMGMSGKPSATVMDAMQQLGMVNSQGQSQFFNSKGQITSFTQMLQTLIQDGKKYNPEQLARLYGHVFGVQGGRAATIFANPQILQQLQGMVKQLQHTKSISQIQTDEQSKVQGQMLELKSNSMTMMIRVARALGPALTPFLHSLNKTLTATLKFEQQHPALLKFVGVFTAIAAATLLTVGPMLMLIGGIGKLVFFFKGDAFLEGIKVLKRLFGVTKQVAAAQEGLDAVMAANPIGIIVLSVAALIAGIVVLVVHWKQVIACLRSVVTWVRSVVTWFSNLSPAAKTVIAVLMPIVGIPLLIMSHWKPISAFFVNSFKTIISWIKQAWTWYNKLGLEVKIAIAIYMPFIGIPLLIISKWRPIVGLFEDVWKAMKPVLDAIGKGVGMGVTDFEKFFHLGSYGKPVLAGGPSGNSKVNVNNHFYISSTNPKGAAKETATVQDKYYRSRFPLAAPR